MTKDWHILLDKAVKTKSFGGLTQNRIKLGQYISRHRALIANLEVPPDAETLRESEGVFLSAQANMVADVYPQFELFADLTPEETIQKSLKAVSRDMETEIAWNLTIKKSLDAFAIKHRIKSYKL